MNIYYISTTPETVISLLSRGVFPNQLPVWLAPRNIICSQDTYTSVKLSNKNYHQTFIVKIKNTEQMNFNGSNFKIIDQIKIDWIHEVYVYSSQGEKLLKRLLAQNNLSHLERIVTQLEEAYPKKFSDEELKLLTSQSGFFSNSSTNLNMSANISHVQTKAIPDIYLVRIFSLQDHLERLRYAFESAKETVMITSYGINYDTFSAAELLPLIRFSRRKGVDIYFYYSDMGHVDQQLVRLLRALGVRCNQTITHSKILAVDHEWVAVGSFNWLSGIDNEYGVSQEGTIICHDDLCEDLIEDLWEYLKIYRCEQFGNFEQAEAIENELEGSIVYEIEKNEELIYLTSLDEQLGFLEEVFEMATQRIIICSPFISSVASYKENLNPHLINSALAKNVEIFFVCLNNSENLYELNQYLNSFRSHRIHLLQLNHFHNKTIIVDDSMIAEGSFNWLSASRNRNSDYHNHEATLVVKGNISKKLIENFYQTEIGNRIQELSRTVYLGLK